MTGQPLWLDEPAFADLKFPVAEGQHETEERAVRNTCRACGDRHVA
jgi:hypothetical protein